MWVQFFELYERQQIDICRYSPEIVPQFRGGNFGGFSLKFEGKCQKFDENINILSF